MTQVTNVTYLDSINKTYIYYIIKRASTFSSLFRSFLFRHLNLCCPLLHKSEFFIHKDSIKNVRLRVLYNEICEQRTFLTLKQRCRLVIKESIRRYPADIKCFVHLPLTLQYYLSFDFLNPKFVQITLDKLNHVDGRIKPLFFDELQFHEHGLEEINGYNDWEDQIPEDIEYENDDNDDNELVDDLLFLIHCSILAFFYFRNTIMMMLIFLMKKDFIQITSGDRLRQLDIDTFFICNLIVFCFVLKKKKSILSMLMFFSICCFNRNKCQIDF